jgi:hypothetical protein
VALCTETSNPTSHGRKLTGDVNVLSMMLVSPCRRANATMASRVEHLHERIRNALDVHDPGFRPHRGIPAFFSFAIDARTADAESRRVVLEPRLHAAVQRIVRDDVIAALQECDERARDGGHSARRDERGLGVFEDRQSGVKHTVIR